MRGSGLPRWFAVATLLAVLTITSFTLAEPPKDSKDAKPAETEALALDQKLLATAKKDSEIMTNLAYLSDVIGPRLTGSAAAKKANQWTAEKMKSYGLTNVELEAWTIPAGWERGTATARLIEPDNGRTLTLAAMGWTPGTNGKIEADVVVITAKNSKDLTAYKGKLKGAVVLQGPPATIRPITDMNFFPSGGRRPPMQDTKPDPDKKPEADTKTDPDKKPEANAKPNPEKKPDGDTKADPDKKPDAETKPEPEQPNFRAQAAFRRELADFLRSEGAAVLLMDAGKPHGLLNMTGSWRGSDRASAPEPMPTAFIAHEHYALLYRLATRPAPAKTRLEIEINNKFIPGPVVVYNTVGEIKGSEKPDEYVILGAHLDSWDLGQGSTDNGTGSSVVLETARIMVKSGVKPKRTIRFILFTGEEQGLYGSKAYVQQHKDELPRMSMCLVHDTGTGKVLGIGLQGRAPVKPVLEPELVSLKDIGFKEVSLRRLDGSDHQSFDAAGVPGFAVQQDMAEYRLTHHSQSDTLDKAQEADLIQGAQVMAVTGLRVANMPDLLPRAKRTADQKDPE
jgi:carboxypeptidase Q